MTHPTEPLDLDALEAKARAATKSGQRWSWASYRRDNHCGVGVTFDEHTGREMIGEITADKYRVSEAVAIDVTSRAYAAHIAAFDPPTVLRLIAAARAGTGGPHYTLAEVADLTEFGASDAACHHYPGEDQAALREAYCRGAGDVVRRKGEGQ